MNKMLLQTSVTQNFKTAFTTSKNKLHAVAIVAFCFIAISARAQFGASPWTAPSGTYTIPAGVTQITVRCHGGGGAGGGASATDRNGGGGGGGACVTVTNYAVTPGQQITVAVGAGGVGVSANTGGTGGSSTVTLLPSTMFIRAAGGAGGTRAASSSTAGFGGAGGDILGNIPFNTGFAGGRGGNSDPTTTTADRSGGGGGGAGSTGNGGTAANASGGAGPAGAAGSGVGGGAGGAGRSSTSSAGLLGNPGNNFGGGGSGSTVWTGANRPGADGAPGTVVITYIVNPTPTISSFSPSTFCPGQTTVTINGTNFTSTGTTVSFGGGAAQAVTFVSTTQITVLVPAGVSGTTFTVTTASGTSAASTAYTVGTLPSTPTAVAPSASNVCPGVSIDLNATSAGNTINWYTVSTGGTAILTGGTSGVNSSYLPVATNTYFAESQSAAGCRSAARASSGLITRLPSATAGTFQYADQSVQSICVGNTISCNNVTSPTNGGSGTLGVVWYCGEYLSGPIGPGGTYGNWVGSSAASLVPVSSALGTAAGSSPFFSLSNYNPQTDFAGKTNFVIYRRAYTDNCGIGVGGLFIDQLFYVNITPIPTAPVVGTITQPGCAITTGSVALSGLPAGSWTITGSPSGSATGSGTTGSVTGLTASTSYTFTVSVGSCISAPSTAAVLNAVPVTTVPTVTPSYNCNTGAVTLTPSALGANESYRWYDAASAGSIVSTANPFSPVITNTTNYFLTKYNSVTLCESAPRLPVVASVSGLDRYTATRATGITYTPLSGATSVSTWLNTTSTDNMSASLPIGFSFPFDGVNHTQFRVSLDGFITFNTATRANGGNLPSCNAAEPYSLDNSIFTVAGKAGTLQAIAPFYNDLEQSLNSLNTTISYLRSGTSPNQILTVQWVGVTEDYDNSNCSGTCVESNYNFQVRLYESSGNIEFIYGTMTRGDATGINDATYTVGINSSKLTASPNSSQLFTQQTANTATFISTASNGLTTIPTANSRITLTRTVPVAVNSIPLCTKNIYPLDGATNQCPNTSLSWEAVDGQPTGYDVYFSTSNPPLTLVSSNQTSNYYNPTLANGITYFWRIVPRNSFGAAASTPVYSFSTSNGDNITGFTSTNGTISGSTVTLCQGQSTTIAIQGNLSAGSEYQWTSPFLIDIGCKNNPPYPLLSNCAAASRNFNSLAAGTYTYDVFTRGCNATSACQRIILNVVGTVTTPTAITFTAGTEPTCQLTSAGTTTDYNSTTTRGVLSWSLTSINNTVGTLLASAINSSTGVVTWPNGWAGSVTIRVESTGCNGPSTAVTRAVTVTANMTAGTASTTPSLCINTPLTAITHNTTLATGIGAATNLPTGVIALFGSNTITISGTPSVSGTFNYSIPLTGGCGTVSATGTITVNALPTSAGIARSPSGPQYTGTPISYTAVATPSGTYTYTWSSTPILAGVSTSPASGSGTPFNTTVTNANAFNSNPGGTGSISYTVIATDANGCTVTGIQNPIIHPVVQDRKSVV